MIKKGEHRIRRAGKKINIKSEDLVKYNKMSDTEESTPVDVKTVDTKEIKDDKVVEKTLLEKVMEAAQESINAYIKKDLALIAMKDKYISELEAFIAKREQPDSIIDSRTKYMAAVLDSYAALKESSVIRDQFYKLRIDELLKPKEAQP